MSRSCLRPHWSLELPDDRHRTCDSTWTRLDGGSDSAQDYTIERCKELILDGMGKPDLPVEIVEIAKPCWCGPMALCVLIALGFGVPDWLRLVPVDFEAGDRWWQQLTASGFDPGKPAVVASSGVSMYTSRRMRSWLCCARSPCSLPAPRWP
jgi:leucine carboxyl methyltransferase